jgi:hypothetical protein
LVQVVHVQVEENRLSVLRVIIHHGWNRQVNPSLPGYGVFITHAIT